MRNHTREPLKDDGPVRCHSYCFKECCTKQTLASRLLPSSLLQGFRQLIIISIESPVAIT